MICMHVNIQVLTGMYGTYQPLCLIDKNENNLVHATAKFHIADCLSVSTE